MIYISFNYKELQIKESPGKTTAKCKKKQLFSVSCEWDIHYSFIRSKRSANRGQVNKGV